MTSAVQIAAQKLTTNIELKTLKTLVEKTHAQKFGDLRKRSTWELAYYDVIFGDTKIVGLKSDLEVTPGEKLYSIDGTLTDWNELTPGQKKVWENAAKQETVTPCKVDTSPAILPVLPEDEEIPFFFPKDSDDAVEFRELLDNSLLKQESVSLFDLGGYVKQTIKRIAQLSRDWCLRESRGFMSIINGQFTKFTTRTPRRVMRRAAKFIAEVCKASKGMLHAQYSIK